MASNSVMDRETYGVPAQRKPADTGGDAAREGAMVAQHKATRGSGTMTQGNDRPQANRAVPDK
jgi:hypothetical protein